MQNRIKHLHKLVTEFSKETNALEFVFSENKKLAEWTIKYNIIKFQFVLNKKEKITCPVSTLFCRIYLGKNGIFYYHIPELMEYIDAENYQCYYFPYMDSEERLSTCFSVLSEFLKQHYEAIQTLAKNAEMSEKIKASKMEDMIALFTQKEPEPGQLEVLIDAYEKYVLLARNTGEGAYRQFVCGNHEKAQKLYAEMEQKGGLTSYEKRLFEFIKRREEYIALPKECNTFLAVEQNYSASAEGKNILRMALICELVLSILFVIPVAIINGILSQNTVYYAGMDWYYVFLFAGVPALFGGIAFRNGIGKGEDALANLINPKWVEKLSKAIFVLTFVGCLFVSVSCAFFSARFYENSMDYNHGEGVIPTSYTSCKYKDLKNVYYSEGLNNVYGDYIERASYLLEFKDGTVWDSDGYISVEEVEENILPIIDSYYDEIKYIKVKDKVLNHE